MTPIEWKAEFETGNFEIDSQHRLFVKILQKLHTAKQDKNKQLVELLFVELLRYAEFHFCSEENIMFANNYPHMQTHRQEHEELLANLRNRTFSLKYDFIDYDKLEQFLTSWFVDHTSVEDRRLSSFLQKCNVVV